MRIFHRQALAALAIGVAFGPTLDASMVQKMDLQEVCSRADKIFRGTVLTVKDGTIEAGGGVLPTMTYVLEVDEAFQGSFVTKDGETFAEITTLGRIKTAADSDPLANLPRLEVGGDYLLLTSQPSAIGLSAPVGFGQGCYTISGGKDGELTATDGLGNSHAYDALAEQIRTETEQ